MNTKNSIRNYGIDIARLTAMLMVVLLHCLLNGGILSKTSTSSKSLLFWFVENLVIVAVNLFAMITGFLMVTRTARLKKLIRLWVEVWFWSVFVTLIVSLFAQKFDVLIFAKSLFPVISNSYWYFNAYVVLFLLIPFLNSGFQYINLNELDAIIIILSGLSVSVGFIGNLFESHGYSAIWLLIMYLIGARIRMGNFKFGFRLKQSMLVAIYLFCAVLSTIGEYISIRYLGSHILAWISYNSPIVFIESIALFLFIVNIHVENLHVCKFLKWASPLSFAVYLIDSNPSFYSLMHGKFSFIKEFGIVEGLFLLVVISLCMFFIFLVLDYFRSKLFWAMRYLFLFNSKH